MDAFVFKVHTQSVFSFVQFDKQKEIQGGGKHLCSVVYGSLPPATRTRQVFVPSFS